MTHTRHSRKTVTAMLLFGMTMCVLSACGSSKKTDASLKVAGSRSAIFSTDALALRTAQNLLPRKSSSLGVFVSEYLSNAPLAMAAQGAIDGILIQQIFMDAQQGVSDPDFDLLQAFADALEVDVADLLNRSDNREQALDTYSEALTNVATRANDRFKELSSSLDELKDVVRQLNKEQSTADRDVKNAIKDKDFTAAGEAQKILSEKQAAYAEATLKQKETESMTDALDQLLMIYGQKILAIQKNREALIIGIHVVDVPGIDDLKLIERAKNTRSNSRTNPSYDELFQNTML